MSQKELHRTSCKVHCDSLRGESDWLKPCDCLTQRPFPICPVFLLYQQGISLPLLSLKCKKQIAAVFASRAWACFVALPAQLAEKPTEDFWEGLSA